MKREDKLFLRYIGPSMIGMLIAGSFSIVDTIFIGQGLGKTGLAAVALTWPLVMLFGALGELNGSGAAVLVSQYRGSGDLVNARRTFGNMVTLNMLASLVISPLLVLFLEPIMQLLGATQELLPIAIEYAQVMIYGAFFTLFMESFISVIRNDGSPLFSMFLMVVGLICNIILDWLFIIAFQWGAAGAAYATIVSQALSAVIGACYFLTGRTELVFSWHNMLLKLKSVREITVSGIPIFGNMLSIIAMLHMHNAQSLKYGKVDGLAAYTLVAGLESLGSILMTGLAIGIQPLTAYMYGARQYKRQNRMGNKGYWWAFVLGIGLMLFSFVFRGPMTSLVGLTGQAAELAMHGVLLSSTAFILLGVIRVAGFYYQSTGKILDSSLLIYGDSFFALPLCLYTLPIWFGMDGVWLAMPVSRIILFGFVCYLWFGKQSRKEVCHG